jgi:chemotaxis regulatin CheY-phosphate phosphatase CheZ
MIRANISKDLERRFRELAMRRFGYAKGSLQKAVEEAIARWVSWVEEENLKFERDPVEAIDGILADLDIDSVELQHRLKEVWVSEMLKDVSG